MIHSSPPRDRHLDHEDIFSNQPLDLQTFQLIKCPTHPNYAVEAFSAKESLKSNLLCIKCILSPEISKEIKGDLIAIKDLISKAVEKGHSRQESQRPPDNFDKRFLEFTQRDYIGIFDRHVETQMEKLNKELERVKESLGKLREQFVDFFEKQGQTLKTKDEELKQKAMQYFDEREEIEKRYFGSVEQVLGELSGIEQFGDYEKFINILFKKSALSKGDQNGSLTHKLTVMMEELRVQASSLKSMRIDTQILQDIREGLESMNILDKATVVPGIAPVNKNLERILDKLRNTEKRPGSKNASPVQNLFGRSKDSNEKTSPYTDKELQKPSMLQQILKERYGLDKSKKSTPTQEREGSYGKKQNFQERDRAKEPETRGWESYIPSNTKIVRPSVQGFASMDKKIPYEPKSPYYEAKKSSSQRMLVERDSDTDEELEGGRLTKRLPPQERSFSFQASVPGKSSGMDIEQARPRYSTQQTFSQGSQQKSEQFKRSSTSPYRIEPASQGEDTIASPKFPSSQPQEGKTSTSQETQKGDQGKSGSKELVKSTSSAEDSRGSLISQWIDQKVNGFLVYQNTLRDQTGTSVEDFTKYCSEKWFHLSKPERDEYTSLSLKIRADLKKEFKDLTMDDSDLTQLQELLDQRIKSFRK